MAFEAEVEILGPMGVGITEKSFDMNFMTIFIVNYAFH